MNKNKKIVKTIKKERPPQLDKILSRALLACGLYFPVNEENKKLFKIPEPIKEIYKRQLEKEISEDEIKIVYKLQGEMFGYLHVDNFNQITMICYEINEEYKSNLVFMIDTLTINLRNELNNFYPLAIRCLLIPNSFFYDKDIPEEILNRYAKNKADYTFYTNIDNYKNSILYNNKIIRNTVDSRFILEYFNDIDSRKLDKVIDFRVYKNNISEKWLFDSLVEHYKNIFYNLFKCKSFFDDRKPDDPETYSNNYITRSLTGFNKIIFVFPENIDIKSIYVFISSVFTDALIDNNINEIDFFNRFSFCIMKDSNLNKINHKDILNNSF